MEKKNKTKIIILASFILMLFTLNISFASVKLNNIYFDPAIITAGDSVDMVVEYQGLNLDVDKLADPNYKFGIELVADDDISQKYIQILNRQGDNLRGTVLSGEVYNKVFRLKIAYDAPAANYQMKLIGRWYHNGAPEKIDQEIKVYIPVKKEGIILNVANIVTDPSQVRPGDKFVELKTYIENVGEKDSKSVEITLSSNSSLITSAYSDNNRKWVGRVNKGESKQISFFLNVDEAIKSGLYNLALKMQYLDLDDNSYNKTINLPFLIKKRSYLKVINYTGSGLAGDNGVLKVTLKNTGSVDAESVDVRILKDSSQPFEFDVRSSFVGELKPGQTGIAIFHFKIDRDAAIKEHSFNLLIRSKGDSDEGDDNIYTYSRTAKFDVTDVAENKLFNYGMYGLGIILILFIFNKIFFGRKKSKK